MLGLLPLWMADENPPRRNNAQRASPCSKISFPLSRLAGMLYFASVGMHFHSAQGVSILLQCHSWQPSHPPYLPLPALASFSSKRKNPDTATRSEFRLHLYLLNTSTASTELLYHVLAVRIDDVITQQTHQAGAHSTHKSGALKR
jgi:hypothetical protein